MIELGRCLRASGEASVELIGAVDRDVEDEIRTANHRGDVCWSGFVPNQEAFERLPGAIAGLSLLHDTPNYRVSMPTKVLEYLACGLPVISTPLSAARQLIEEYEVGVIVDVGDIDAVVRAVRELAGDERRYRELQQRAVSVITERSWQRELPSFLAALAEEGCSQGHAEPPGTGPVTL